MVAHKLLIIIFKESLTATFQQSQNLLTKLEIESQLNNFNDILKTLFSSKCEQGFQNGSEAKDFQRN